MVLWALGDLAGDVNAFSSLKSPARDSLEVVIFIHPVLFLKGNHVRSKTSVLHRSQTERDPRSEYSYFIHEKHEA